MKAKEYDDYMNRCAIDIERYKRARRAVEANRFKFIMENTRDKDVAEFVRQNEHTHVLYKGNDRLSPYVTLTSRPSSNVNYLAVGIDHANSEYMWLPMIHYPDKIPLKDIIELCKGYRARQRKQLDEIPARGDEKDHAHKAWTDTMRRIARVNLVINTLEALL